MWVEGQEMFLGFFVHLYQQTLFQCESMQLKTTSNILKIVAKIPGREITLWLPITHSLNLAPFIPLNYAFDKLSFVRNPDIPVEQNRLFAFSSEYHTFILIDWNKTLYFLRLSKFCPRRDPDSSRKASLIQPGPSLWWPLGSSVLIF